MITLPSIFAENPYEITANLNKKFVETDERIEVSGNVNNFNPDFKNLIRILETKEGHRVDYDTTPVNEEDGSFGFSWQVGTIYDSKWVPNSEYVIKINYAGIDNWKELEFTYCDKRQQESSDYLKLCQEAYGVVEAKNSNQELQQSSNSNQPSTQFQDGMELESRGKDPTGSNLWVETDESYTQRILYPLIISLIVISIILGVIIVIIYKVRNRKKKLR